MKALMSVLAVCAIVGGVMASPSPKAAVVAAARVEFDAGFERASHLKIAGLNPAQKAAYTTYRAAVLTALQRELTTALFCKQLSSLTAAEKKTIVQAMVRVQKDPKVTSSFVAFMATF